MGVVYRARDEHLDRDVAIKVLPAGTLATPADRRRFRKEALLLSKLNHPNIETVHDFDSQDGLDFLVMEYVPGTTLAHRLTNGPLPEKELVRLGTQVAEALAVAHDHGVLHRDLKPANLQVTPEGRVKILDFGLAKLLPAGAEASEAETDTAMGRPVGTWPYMSPEQLRGESVDARTDIWSMGVVLYEMSCGQRPFRGATAPHLSDQILHQPTLTPRAHNPHVSPHLERIILKCLEKDPGSRYQSAKDLAVDLRRLAAGSAPAAPGILRRRPWRSLLLLITPVVVALAALLGYRLMSRPRPPGPTGGTVTLAVLPFADLSPARDLEFFCDGMTDQIISALSGIPVLRVTARTSVFAIKGMQGDVRDIGRKLGVSRLLEGSVRRVTDGVRITIQLVSTSDGFDLWSKSYDRSLSDVTDIQEAIAQDVARATAGGPDVTVPGTAIARGTTDSEAYLLYLKGRYYWNKRTEASLRTSLKFFTDALEHDPQFALAYVGVADAYAVLEAQQQIASGEAVIRVREAVAKALALDGTLPEAHASRANLMEREWKWGEAEREYLTALKTRPGDARILCWYAQLLAEVGRYDEALDQIRRAAEIDPLSTYVHNVHALVLYLARRYDDALDQIAFTRELDPEDHVAHELLAYVNVQKGKREDAVAAAHAASILRGDGAVSVVLGYTNAVAGNRDVARGMLPRLLDLWKRRQGSSGGIAVVYAGLDDRDNAMRWLGTACRERDSWITLLGADPVFDALRPDPRFRDLLKKAGLGG